MVSQTLALGEIYDIPTPPELLLISKNLNTSKYAVPVWVLFPYCPNSILMLNLNYLQPSFLN